MMQRFRFLPLVILMGAIPLMDQARAQNAAIKVTDFFIEKAFAVSGHRIGGGALANLVLPEERIVFSFKYFGGWQNGVRLAGVVEHAAYYDTLDALIVHYRDTGVLDRVTATGTTRFQSFDDPIVGIADVVGFFAVALGGETPRLVLLDVNGIVRDSVAEEVAPGSLRSFFRNETLFYRTGSRIAYRTAYTGKLSPRVESDELAPGVPGDPVGSDRGDGSVVLSTGAYFAKDRNYLTGGSFLKYYDYGFPPSVFGAVLSPGQRCFLVNPTGDGNTRVEWRGTYLDSLRGLVGIPGVPIGVWNVQGDANLVTIENGQPHFVYLDREGATFGALDFVANPSTVITPLTERSIAPGESMVRFDLGEIFAKGNEWELPNYWPSAFGNYGDYYLVTRVEVDYPSNTLLVHINPYTFGTQALTINLSNGRGQVTAQIVFSSAPPDAPEVALMGDPVLNSQTGFFEQRVRVTNRSGRGLGAFLLTFTGLADEVEVYNRSGTDANGNAIIRSQQDINDGESVVLVVEYLSTRRLPPIGIGINSETLPKVAAVTSAEGVSLAIDRALRREDGSVLIEFTAEPGATYQVQYLSNWPWLTCPGTIRAAGNRVQWIDNGPPKTLSHPSGAPSRMYRVKRISGGGE
jgi:hypothetical protein